MRVKHKHACITVLTYMSLSLAGVASFRLPSSLPAAHHAISPAVHPTQVHPDDSQITTMKPSHDDELVDDFNCPIHVTLSQANAGEQ
ncbi:MAG: hypothetical protein O7G85_04905 [Planctomycetota bacterium]|nr:hypothetical protein [Planctomycetota bacterium]